jgi:trehalose 6-phosphate phosphatase
VNLFRTDLGSTAFFLDVDGTLLDIAPTPAEVVVPESLRQTLSSLWRLCGGAVALISGRTIEELDRAFAPLRLPAAGAHGAQVRTAPEAPVAGVDTELDPELRRRVAALALPGMLVEDKGSSIAIHYRQAPDQERPLRAAIDALCETVPPGSVEILPGKAVIELKQPQFNKGTAVRRILAEPPFAGRRPLYIGDDITDQAAFAVLHEFDGIGLSVGRHLPGAKLAFTTASDVRRWLERIVREAQDVA